MQPAHAATNPAAGWFADPQAPNLLRWWDGFQWTHHVHPVPEAAPPVASAATLTPAYASHNAYAAQPAATHAGYGSQPATTHAAYGSQPAATYGVAAATATAAGSTAIGAPSSGLGGSLYDDNPKSVAAIGFSVVYLVIAIATGIVFAGIVPALYTFQAFGRREKLAPAALVCAVVAIAFAFTHWQTR